MSIQGIYIAPKASQAMQSLEQAILLTNRGIDGDRYCTHQGTYSVLRGSQKQTGKEREPGRHLTIMSQDSILEAFARSNLQPPADLGDLRRNVVVQGISSQDLLSAIGHVIELGNDGVKVLVQRHSVPCMYNERKNKIKGMMEAIWMEAGVCCQILQGGSIAKGDSITILPYDDAFKSMLDPGSHSPGFIIPPSRRTKEMVFATIQAKKKQKELLMQLDPEGVKITQESYASVGLQMWPETKN